MIRLGGITWILTYQCNLACGHCFFDTAAGGPYLDPALIDRVLGDCPEGTAMHFQHLSGGEIFLDEARLFTIIGRIRDHWQGNIGLSTNGFWGDTMERASSTVERLAQAGVTGISVSSDWFHSQHLDPAAPRRVAKAVRQVGIGSHSWLMGARLDPAAHGAGPVNLQGDELARQAGGASGLPPATPRVRSIGKGARCNLPKKPGIPGGPCTELSTCLGNRGPFNPAMVWIDPYGNVSICHGLVIGNAWDEAFSTIINRYAAGISPLTQALAEHGPQGIHQLALDRGLTLPTAYFDECDLCWTSRAALRRAGHFPAVLGPQEAYPA